MNIINNMSINKESLVEYKPLTDNQSDIKKLLTPYRSSYFSKTKNNKYFKENNINSTKNENLILKNSSNLYYNSYSNYVPYSISDIEKQINYFNSCAYYEYAGSLNKYLELLIIYKNGKLQYPPKYPSLFTFNYEPKYYKRPIMYQGAGRTNSGRAIDLSLSKKYEEPISKKEITLINEMPHEIGIIIK